MKKIITLLILILLFTPIYAIDYDPDGVAEKIDKALLYAEAGSYESALMVVLEEIGDDLDDYYTVRKNILLARFGEGMWFGIDTAMEILEESILIIENSSELEVEIAELLLSLIESDLEKLEGYLEDMSKGGQ